MICINGQNTSKLCVSKVPFFNHLDESEMYEIASISMHQQFAKGETIYEAGDPLDYLYIVHKGRVKVFQLFESGREQLLRLLQPGEFMGELALFTEETLESYAEALEDTEICMIHRHKMQQLMHEHPSIAIKILEQFSRRLDRTERLIGELSAKNVEARIAGYLLQLQDEQQSQKITLPMTKRDLASYLGTTQETVSRRFSNLQKNNIIEQEGHRRIKIIDELTLRQLATEDM